MRSIASARSRKSAFQLGQKLTVGCSLILVAAALVVGWWYWSLQRQSADLDQQIVDAERETVRLRSVIQQVQQFEQRRGQLQQRVTLIEQLRKGPDAARYICSIKSAGRCRTRCGWST